MNVARTLMHERDTTNEKEIPCETAPPCGNLQAASKIRDYVDNNVTI